MRIEPYNRRTLDIRGGEIVFRQAAWPLLLGLVVCGGLLSGGIWLLSMTGKPDGPPAIFAWAFICFPGLVVLSMLRSLLRTFSEDNWLLRCSPGRLSLKVGPTAGASSQPAWIVQLAANEIQWVRPRKLTTITKDSEGTTHTYESFLDMKPADIDLEPLRQCIAQASSQRKVFGKWLTVKSRFGLAISVTSEGIIRLTWVGRNGVISPRLSKAVMLLGQEFHVEPLLREKLDLRTPPVDAKELEQRIIGLIETGRTVEAVKLARTRYGYSLTEARTFVEDLAGGHGRARST